MSEEEIKNTEVAEKETTASDEVVSEDETTEGEDEE
jgi:hypothetical protein